MTAIRDQRPLWAVFVALGTVTAAAFVALFALGAAPWLAGGLYTGLSALTAATVLYATRRYRSPGHAGELTGWYLLGAGQLAYAAGDSIYLAQSLVHGSTAFPSVADALYLAQYPLIIGALVSFVRRRTPGRRTPALLDAGILATAAGLLSWVYLIGPLTEAADMTTPARLVTVAYPLGDLLVLVIGLRLLLGGGARSPSYLMLLAGLCTMLAGDTSFTLLGGGARGWECFLWLLTYTLLGGAALHPSMRRVDDPPARRATDMTSARLVALAAASLLAPVVLLVQYETGRTRDVPVIAVACALLFLLVLGRMAGLVADQRRLAATDLLTGLHTRRAFEEHLRARRGARPFGVILLDIDHFKRINDSFGHPAGDRVLREVADRLRAAAGPGVAVARYGGEEFALLVPSAEATRTAELADRLRSAVSGGPVDVGGGVLRAVTVSAGTAVLPADTAVPDELILLADRALYAAKRAGRDRVVAAGTLPPPAAAVSRRPSDTDEWPAPLPRRRPTLAIDPPLSDERRPPTHDPALSARATVHRRGRLVG
ncbi:GGDEF domain-containing protein [Dactylosporangium sp. NPDC051484]|uniref:GGDEF domain-containing protein n=1 Tax=Dactylosporangium sp. NPDC051484 TaxID=3154942 RepID=UPI00344EB435